MSGPGAVPAQGAPQVAHYQALVNLPGAADLRDLWNQPAGPARVGEAVRRMQEASRRAVAGQLPALSARLPAGVSATLVEPLWIDNSALVDLAIDQAHASPDALERIHALIGWQALVVPAPPTSPPPSMPQTDPGAQLPPRVPPWNLQRIGASDAWKAGHRGAGVTVGIVDSGTNFDHGDLASAYRGRAANGSADHAGNYFDPRTPDTVPAALRATSGHGTWVAGLVAGSRTGVAPDAHLVAAVNWGTTRNASPVQDEMLRRVDFLRSLQWMTAPTDATGRPNPALAPQIVNNSWHASNGSAQATDRYLDGALRNMAAAGIVNVFAAGNTGGPGSIGYPADLDSVIAVGGVDAADKPVPGLAQGPSRATDRPKPDVAAPETDLVSLRAAGGYQRDQHGGTSSTSPQVAGVLAVVDGALMARGEAPVDLREARQVLGVLARDVHTPGPDDQTGVGVPDLRRLDVALQALRRSRTAHRPAA